MQEPQKDPKVIRAGRHRLVAGETVLWACAQRGLGRRGLVVLGAVALAYLAMWAALAKGSLIGVLILFAISSPFLLWWLAEMMARSFIATDRRVIFISRIWPHRWSYWNYAEMNAPLVQVGKGKRIIHLQQFVLAAHGEPTWVSRGAVYPGYIERVPDIESVRELILAHIARMPAPIAEPKKSTDQRPRIFGTRTG